MISTLYIKHTVHVYNSYIWCQSLCNRCNLLKPGTPFWVFKDFSFSYRVYKCIKVFAIYYFFYIVITAYFSVAQSGRITTIYFRGLYDYILYIMLRAWCSFYHCNAFFNSRFFVKGKRYRRSIADPFSFYKCFQRSSCQKRRSY